MSPSPTLSNFDEAVVEGFGEEWTAFDQSSLSSDELQAIFNDYFKIFPWADLPDKAVGFDAGCGSGRWARYVAPRVGKLFCVDASAQALNVARKNIGHFSQCTFVHASVDAMPIENDAMDFGYSLGVLHHIPDPAAGIRACVKKLKIGAPFLIYLYYAFDNRPLWFRALWRISDAMRRTISRLPFVLRRGVAEMIALCVYWPLARTALLLEKLGLPYASFPLSAYRHRSLYVMRNDALDRFGTQLEFRFTRTQMVATLRDAGLEDIRVHEGSPYWCMVGRRVR